MFYSILWISNELMKLHIKIVNKVILLAVEIVIRKKLRINIQAYYLLVSNSVSCRTLIDQTKEKVKDNEEYNTADIKNIANFEEE